MSQNITKPLSMQTTLRQAQPSKSFQTRTTNEHITVQTTKPRHQLYPLKRLQVVTLWPRLEKKKNTFPTLEGSQGWCRGFSKPPPPTPLWPPQLPRFLKRLESHDLPSAWAARLAAAGVPLTGMVFWAQFFQAEIRISDYKYYNIL